MYRKRLYTTVSKYIPNNLEKMNIKDKNKLLNQLAELKQEKKQNIDLTLPKIVEMNSIIKTNPSIDNKKLLNGYLNIVQNSNNEIPKINDSIDEIYESINEEEIYLNDENNIKGGKSKRNKTRMKSKKKKNNKSRRFNKKMKGSGAFFSRPNQEPEIEEDNYQRVHRVPHSMVFDFDSNGDVVDLTSTGERGKWMFDVTHNSIDSILRIQLARYLTTIDNLQSRIADFPENSQISYPYNHYIHELHDSQIKYLELVKIYTYIQDLPVAVSSVSNYSHDVHILEDPHPNERYPNQVGLPVATLTSNNTTRNNRRNNRRFGGKKKKTRKNKK